MSLARDLANQELSENQRVLREAGVLNSEGFVRTSPALQQFLLMKFEDEFVAAIKAARPGYYKADTTSPAEPDAAAPAEASSEE